MLDGVDVGGIDEHDPLRRGVIEDQPKPVLLDPPQRAAIAGEGVAGVGPGERDELTGRRPKHT